MKFIAFLFREGSSIIYALYLALFALTDVCVICLPGGALSMFLVALGGLFYLSLQNALAAYSRVGNDRPILDFFFSLAPLFVLAMITVLSVTGVVSLSKFEVLALLYAGCIAMIDVIFNTQVVFKMNRLATDMVQMK